MADSTDPGLSPQEKLQAEANERLAEARKHKRPRAAEFKECYFVAAPHRDRNIYSETLPTLTSPPMDAPELQTDIAMVLVPDFINEVINAEMPEAQFWCERAAGMYIPEEAFNQVKDEVKAGDKKIFAAIRASNLYAVLPKAMNPDFAIALCALWIDQPHAHSAISVKAVPIREIEVNLGPDGEIDDRFAVRYVRNCHARATLGKTIADQLPEDIAKEIDGNKATQNLIVWGYWRLWDRIDDEVWQFVVLFRDKLVYDKEIKGEGCCPLIVMPFNPSADSPYGAGPLFQGLPTIRQIDAFERLKREAIGRGINGPISFPDDSFANISEGLEDGEAYAIRVGSEGAIKQIYPKVDINPAVFEIGDMEKRLRKLFFIDFPEQTGDTPPTLGQWLDEMARAQRRLGMPGQTFWREGPAKIFMRFKFLLEMVGALPKIVVDGRAIALMPYNPAQRAADQQEIATAVQYLQTVTQLFPEEAKIRLDGDGTMKRLADKMRVAGERGLIAFRDPKQIQAALGQISQLMQGRLGNAAPQQAPPAIAP